MVYVASCTDHCIHTGVAGLPAGAGQCCNCNQQFGLSGVSQMGSGAQSFRTSKHTGNYGAGSSAGPFWTTIRANGGKD